MKALVLYCFEVCGLLLLKMWFASEQTLMMRLNNKGSVRRDYGAPHIEHAKLEPYLQPHAVGHNQLEDCTRLSSNELSEDESEVRGRE